MKRKDEYLKGKDGLYYDELGNLLNEAGLKVTINMDYPYRKWTLRFDGATDNGHIMTFGNYDKPHSLIEDIPVIELAAMEALANAYGAQGVELHDTKKQLAHALRVAEDRKAVINNLRLEKGRR